MDLQNRIIEMRVVQPDEIAPNPKNWRSHPQAQRDALRGVLAQIGITDTLVAYHSERNGGRLTLIDGHERATIAVPWPCLILDLTDAEADLDLATHDPIGRMATSQADQLDALLRSIETDNAAVQALLDREAKRAGLFARPLELVGADDGTDLPLLDLPMLPSHIRMVQLFLTTESQPRFVAMAARLGAHFGTNNPTDTVMETLRYACESLNLLDE